MAAVVHRAQQCSVLCSKGQRFSANGLVNSSFLNCTSNKSLKLQTNQPKITLFFQSLIFTKISVDLERLYLEVTEQTLSLCLWFCKVYLSQQQTWLDRSIWYLFWSLWVFVSSIFTKAIMTQTMTCSWIVHCLTSSSGVYVVPWSLPCRDWLECDEGA